MTRQGSRGSIDVQSQNQNGVVLLEEFFARHALVVARQLLGKYLVVAHRGEPQALKIHETEAYIGAHDLASHGRFGRTRRTEVLFGPPGHWYVYFTYGMYWMLNAVTGRDGEASGVLIRGAGSHTGPGKLTRDLAIDGRFNGLSIPDNQRMWIEDRGAALRRGQVRRTARIGIDYAGKWKDKPYRFLLRQERASSARDDARTKRWA
jgi:DNA-3-methyladenine glycosylase